MIRCEGGLVTREFEGYTQGSEEWKNAIVGAYRDHTARIEDISARFGCCLAHVSWLAKRARKRGDDVKLRGKGWASGGAAWAAGRKR